MPTGPVPTTRRRHRHHDRPDTDAAFRRAASLPDGPEREALRKEIVCAWMPMASRLARQFRNRGESLEDLEQVAQLGLVKAVARFDPRMGTAFESYAVPTIVGEVKRHFRDHLWGVHVPRHVQELRNRVRRAHHELSHSIDGKSPDVAQLAERTGLTPAEVRTGLAALDSYAVLSLDAELTDSDSGYSLLDTLGDAEPGFDRVVERESVRRRLRQLPEREQRILYLRYFRDMTQRQIGEQLGISQMHVSRLLTRTCTRLRKQVESGRPAARRRPGPAAPARARH
ncbi:SigB/SigF/SigG family RNA polymerase sigma factor [Streptomyces hoynatensis]|uniref:SigB/SigF/SigG family RNA polymerase sigma factor n=1 Tax=Streptomyces hoynatensis TaxID=1141874 RepID=A0A3A9YY54_9ACTN|nr:SigB/SigF/SigG family RNA polymerase sigma factor [Streptomyces hoynatensis]RKN40156.1 SigB/SigF/SigG family RNA polymerase sigma factor [Streptomyces hoynatensis]